MEVGLGPGHIALDRDLAPHKWGTAPNFVPMSVVAINGWMNQDAT